MLTIIRPFTNFKRIRITVKTFPAIFYSDMSVNMSRTETDSMGEIQVPNSMYYGAQTQRSIEVIKGLSIHCLTM